jgi:DNA-directed RNA polymerase specialized sigma subunit
MPRPKKNKKYFDEREEKAVLRYLKSTSEDEKNKIFEEYLRLPLSTMVESIIRRYKLYRKDMSFENQHDDVMSFLMTKVDKFEPGLKKKAYSYFGTICKNYQMGMMQKDQKEMNRSVSYDDISSNLENRADLVYYIDKTDIDYTSVITKYVTNLEDFIEAETLSENEQKLGYALIEIFTNYDTIFQIGEGNKFNKNLILLSLREMTSLSTKEIRASMKRFKALYGDLVIQFLD